MKEKLTVNVGPMFSGKTTALQQQGTKHLTARHNVVFLKPSFDNRFSESEIVSHDGIKVPCINVDKTLLVEEVLCADVILIDEVQFLSESFVEQIRVLLELGKVIYCSGLDMDYKGDGFATTMHLMALADKINKFAAICENCGAEATMTSKRNDNGNIAELGSKDKYFPSCRKCFCGRK